jgi:group I intron endonuclease
MTGIYLIVNKVNNKVYVGKAINLKDRWRVHKWNLERNKHVNNYLQNAWNKYGEPNFQFEILEECEKEKLIEREQYWMDFYSSFESDNGYNIKKIFEGVEYHSEETKKKISENNSCFWKGKHHSEETKRKMKKNHCDVTGINNPRAKLNWETVKEIRRRYKTENISHLNLSREYGVSKRAITCIINYLTWKTK